MNTFDRLLLCFASGLGGGVGALVGIVGWALVTGEPVPPWGLGGGCAGVGALATGYFALRRLSK